MSRVPYTAEQLKKLGLVEKDGVYVTVSSLVAKKVDKLPSLIEQAKPYVDSITKSQLSMQMFIDTGIILIPPTESFVLPNGEIIHPKYCFDLCPFPAPRMTRSDKWKTNPYHKDPAKRQRKPVTRYFAWRNEFITQADKMGYRLGETLRVVFILPMPKYFNRKKRGTLMGQPHKQRPDTDNMIKSVKDAFNVDDGYVWDERGIKIWGDKGQIIIF